jgi:hypothetical protein
MLFDFDGLCQILNRLQEPAEAGHLAGCGPLARPPEKSLDLRARSGERTLFDIGQNSAAILLSTGFSVVRLSALLVSLHVS